MADTEPAVKTEAAAVKVEQPVVKQENGAAATNGTKASSGPSLDGAMFFRRLQNVYRVWKVWISAAGDMVICIFS